MQKRNFILLIIVLVVAVVAVFGFLYYRQAPTGEGEGDNFGINFISQFNPFSNRTTTPDGNSGTPDNTDSGTTPEEVANLKLKKVSSVPIAGFTVFQKERLIEVAEETTPAEPSDANKKTPAPKTEFVPALRYVERATGNVFQTFVDKIEERKFSTNVIPKIYDAYLGNKGESVV